jgi:hypothetical protein
MPVIFAHAVPPNKSLQRSGGRWYLECESPASIDKVPMINLGEPPGAELSRYTARMGIVPVSRCPLSIRFRRL